MILKPIPELDGYFASDDGRIKSHTGLWLKQNDNGHGYLTFGIRRGLTGNLNRRRYVHASVCSAFHGPKPLPHLEARHLDGDKSNNAPSNLSWGMRVENRRDSLNPGHPAPRGKLTRQDVETIRELASEPPITVREKSVGHVNYAAIARRYDITPRYVGYIVDGEVWDI